MTTTATDTLATLFARILAEPFEDAPRLVYADWLEENGGVASCERCKGSGFEPPEVCLAPVHERRSPGGRVERHVEVASAVFEPPPICTVCSGSGAVSDGRRERAEFVRVQCRIEEMKREYYPQSPLLGGHPAHAEWAALRDRELELWVPSSERWFAGLAGLLRLVQIGDDDPDEMTVLNWGLKDCAGFVRRGFVEAVTLPLADWVGTGTRPGVGPRVVRAHPVVEVRLSDRRPHRYHGSGNPQFAWHRGDHPSIGDDSIQRCCLPERLWVRVAAQPHCTTRGNWADFGSEAAARDSASRALADWARAEAS